MFGSKVVPLFFCVLCVIVQSNEEPVLLKDIHRPQRTLSLEGDQTFHGEPPAIAQYPPWDWFTPYQNEWQYANFNPNEPPIPPFYGRSNATYIHKALPGFLKLVQAAQNATEVANGTSFHRWFGNNNPKVVSGVFERLGFMNFFGSGRTFMATKTVSNSIYLVSDPRSDCHLDPHIVAYMYIHSGMFHVCPKNMIYPYLSGLKCSNLPPAVGWASFTVGAFILHEMTHWDKVGLYQLNQEIGDNNATYAAYDCFKLPDPQKLVNAQNYALFALDAYLSQTCGPRSDPQPPAFDDPDVTHWPDIDDYFPG